MTTHTHLTHLIYAGGTFGSYGKPLTTLPASELLPPLIKYIHQNISPNTSIIDNQIVKDSSQLTPTDLVHFYELLLTQYDLGFRQFVLITGTDTLSYLGAFLAEAFAGSDICVVLTGSMHPLFDEDNIYDYQINQNSDALSNLHEAIGLAMHGESGVYIAFAQENWPAQTVQKIHSHDLMAFTGHSRAGYPANSYIKQLPKARQKNWIEDSLHHLPLIKTTVTSAIIPTIYCIPNQIDWLATQLSSLMGIRPTGIILIGFGTGNVPYNKRVATSLQTLYEHGHITVCTTQCPFGGVSDAYAAGSWQYEHHVLSAGRLTISAIYARLLWLHLVYDTPARRRQRWAYSVRQTTVGIAK